MVAGWVPFLSQAAWGEKKPWQPCPTPSPAEWVPFSHSKALFWNGPGGRIGEKKGLSSGFFWGGPRGPGIFGFFGPKIKNNLGFGFCPFGGGENPPGGKPFFTPNWGNQKLFPKKGLLVGP